MLFSLLKPPVWNSLVHRWAVEEQAWDFTLCWHSCFGTNSPYKILTVQWARADVQVGRGRQPLPHDNIWCHAQQMSSLNQRGWAVTAVRLGSLAQAVPSTRNARSPWGCLCLPWAAQEQEMCGGLAPILPGPFLLRSSIMCLLQRVLRSS